jgi:hypothetical protein
MSKYVKICGIKFNCSNANAAIREDYHILSIYVKGKYKASPVIGCGGP